MLKFMTTIMPDKPIIVIVHTRAKHSSRDYKLPLRDNEHAYVSLNGETCWTKHDLFATDGTQQCGGGFKEERFRVTGCVATLPFSEVDAPLTVRVWTNLDGKADDESFGIDNVVVTKIRDGNTCSNT